MVERIKFKIKNKRPRSKGGKGKRKGSSFEREVCNDLSRLILPNSDETVFWRTAMSGGRATSRFKKGKKDARQIGDITSVHPAGDWFIALFMVECKSYKDLGIVRGLLENQGALAAFWHEAVELAKKHDKEPILIARSKRQGTIVLMTTSGVNKLANSPLQFNNEFVCIHNNVLNCLIINYRHFMRIWLNE